MEFRFETELSLRYLEEIYSSNINYCSKVVEIVRNLQVNGKNLNSLSEFNNNLRFCATHCNGEENGRGFGRLKLFSNCKFGEEGESEGRNSKRTDLEKIIFKIIQVEAENNADYRAMLEGILVELLGVRRELTEFKLSLNAKLRDLKVNLNSKLAVYAAHLRQLRKYENLIQSSVVAILESNFIIDANDCQPNPNLLGQFNLNAKRGEETGLIEGNFVEDCCDVYRLIVDNIKYDDLLNGFFFPVYSYPYNLLSSFNNNTSSRVNGSAKYKHINGSIQLTNGSKVTDNKCTNSNNNNSDKVNNESESIEKENAERIKVFKVKSKCKILSELLLSNFRDFANYNNFVKALLKCDGARKEVASELSRYNARVEEITREFEANISKTNRRLKDLLGDFVIKYYVKRFTSYDAVLRELYSVERGSLGEMSESGRISEICSKVVRFYSSGSSERVCNTSRKQDNQIDLNDRLGMVGYLEEYAEYLSEVAKYYSRLQFCVNRPKSDPRQVLTVVHAYLTEVLKGVTNVYNKIFDAILLFNYNYSNCSYAQTVPKLGLDQLLKANDLTGIGCSDSNNLLCDLQNVYVLCVIYGLSGYFRINRRFFGSSSLIHILIQSNTHIYVHHVLDSGMRNNSECSTTTCFSFEANDNNINNNNVNNSNEDNINDYNRNMNSNNEDTRSNCCKGRREGERRWMKNVSDNRLRLSKLIFRAKCTLWGQVELRGSLSVSTRGIGFCCNLDKNRVFPRKPFLLIDVYNVESAKMVQDRFIVTLLNGRSYFFCLSYAPSEAVVSQLYRVYNDYGNFNGSGNGFYNRNRGNNGCLNISCMSRPADDYLDCNIYNLSSNSHQTHNGLVSSNNSSNNNNNSSINNNSSDKNVNNDTNNNDINNNVNNNDTNINKYDNENEKDNTNNNNNGSNNGTNNGSNNGTNNGSNNGNKEREGRSRDFRDNVNVRIGGSRVLVNGSVDMVLVSEEDYRLGLDEFFELALSSNTNGRSLVSRSRVEMGATNFSPVEQTVTNYRRCRGYDNVKPGDDVQIHFRNAKEQALSHVTLEKTLRYDVEHPSPLLGKFGTVERLQYVFQPNRIVYISISRLENKPYNDVFYTVYVIVINDYLQSRTASSQDHGTHITNNNNYHINNNNINSDYHNNNNNNNNSYHSNNYNNINNINNNHKDSYEYNNNNNRDNNNGGDNYEDNVRGCEGGLKGPEDCTGDDLKGSGEGRMVNVRVYSNIVFNKKVLFNNVIRKEIISKTQQASKLMARELERFRVGEGQFREEVRTKRRDKRSVCISKGNKLVIVLVLFVVIFFKRIF